MATKIVAALVSGILVVGVVIGVVTMTSKGGKGGGGDGVSPEDSQRIASNTKMVTELCAPTDYKETCQKSLSHVKNESDPMEYLKAAILATSEAARKAFNLSGDLVVKANKSEAHIKMALEDCKDLLDDAVQELQASFSSVGDPELHSMDQRAAELQNWLSAVISYQETCMDQFDDGSNEYKTEMKDGMVDAGQLTSNALAIINQLATVLSSLGLDLNFPTTTSRRLLSMGEDGYPTWFSATSRRLLATHAAGNLKPNAVVAQDGSGQFKTITAALAAYKPNKKNKNATYTIYIKAGTYKEEVIVDKKQPNVFMYGDGPSKTIITNNKSNRTGYRTFRSATVAAMGIGFMAKSLAIENTAGAEGHQAVALRAQADMSSFFNCRIDGYQDTLYTQAHRQFYTGCTISGTIDFIFGDASVVIQNSDIVVRKPLANQMNTVTAHGRSDKHETTGLVIQNCRILAEPKLVPEQTKVKSYLGRPWKAYSRAIIMESDISAVIQPEGWLPWAGSLFLDTLYFAEYGNTGAGAATAKRVKWKTLHILKNKNELQQYTVGQFLQGQQWIKAQDGAKVIMGMAH